MPSIPAYSLRQTEEAILNQAKKITTSRQMKQFSNEIATPFADPTDGKADIQAQAIVSQLKDLVPAYVSIDGYIKESTTSNLRTNFIRIEGYNSTINLLGLIDRKLTTILDAMKTLAPNFNFVSVNTIAEMRNALQPLMSLNDRRNGKISTDIRRLRSNVGAGSIDLEPVNYIYTKGTSTLNQISTLLDSLVANYSEARVPSQLTQSASSSLVGSGYKSMKDMLSQPYSDGRKTYSVGMGMF